MFESLFMEFLAFQFYKYCLYFLFVMLSGPKLYGDIILLTSHLGNAIE